MSEIKPLELSNLKELTVFVPLLGTAMAITFDVGFFWGLDISYFTLFSLTEHLVFAIQALPVALALSFAITLSLVILRSTAQRQREADDRHASTLNPQQEIEWRQQRAARTRRASLVTGTISLVWVLVSVILNSFFSTNLSYSIMMFGIMSGIYAIGTHSYPDTLWSPFVLSSYILIASLAITFAIGVDAQNWFVRRGETVHAISLSPGTSGLTGRIVRTGERGVLFYDPGSREISFVPWETVNRIRTLP